MPIKLATSLANGKAGLQAYSSLGLTGIPVAAPAAVEAVSLFPGGYRYIPSRRIPFAVIHSLELTIEVDLELEAELTPVPSQATPLELVMEVEAVIEAQMVAVVPVELLLTWDAKIEARLARISPLDDQNDINDIMALSGFSRRD